MNSKPKCVPIPTPFSRPEKFGNPLVRDIGNNKSAEK
jgi:hypothetical protein